MIALSSDVWMILITIGIVLAFVLGLLLAGMSPMVTDNPDSLKYREAYVVMYAMFSMPAVVVIALVTAWASLCCEEPLPLAWLPLSRS